MTTLTLGKALNQGLRRALAADDKVVLMGEDIGTFGGAFRITDGLKAEFGAHRGGTFAGCGCDPRACPAGSLERSRAAVAAVRRCCQRS